MPKELTGSERKRVGSLFAFVFIPYWLNILGLRFVDMYLKAFSVSGAAELYKKADAMTGSLIGLIFFFVYLWARPSIAYFKKRDPGLLETVRRRADSVHRDAVLMLAFCWAAQLALIRLSYGPIPAAAMPGFAVSLLVQLCVMPTIIDWVRARNSRIMELIYEQEELCRLRPGFSVPLAWKVSLLVFACALVPFALSAAALRFGGPAQDWAGVYNALLAMCSVTLLLGLGVVFYGIQRPMNGLIDRMRRLASGDFSKTRIYFADEIARLKAGFNDMVGGLKERDELHDTFGKYLSIEIARELIHKKKVNLGGEDIEAAVMFCDIRNFTPLSEKLGAAALVDFLNNYFHYITPPITIHNGVINKFIGDAVMAIYTPLLGSADYAADAVRSASAMRRALSEFNASGKAPGKVEFGVGIHCGRLVAGNIGTAARLEYTFIGDTVNAASRLESKTKELCTDIIVSSAVLERAKASLGGALKFEPLGKAALKGKSEALDIYKLV